MPPKLSLHGVTMSVAEFSLIRETQATASIMTSSRRGNWEDSTTWVGGVVPGTSDSVLIADGHTVTIDVSTVCIPLTINDGNADLGMIISGNDSAEIL